MIGLAKQEFGVACVGLLVVAGVSMLGCASTDRQSGSGLGESASVCHQTPRVPYAAPLPSENAVQQIRCVAGSLAPAHAATAPRSIAQEPDQFIDLTRQQVIEIALRDSRVIRELGGRVLDSPESVTTRYDYAIQRNDPLFGPQAALAQFDSVLRSSLIASNNDRVFNNAVLGGGAQQLTQDAIRMQSGISRRLPGGGVVSFDRRLDYDSNNRAANLFPSTWEAQLEAGIRQPLLRGAGRQFNAIAGPNAQPGFYFSNGLVIARMNSQISLLDFEKAVHDFLSDVENAYWTLQQAYRQYEGNCRARDAAHATWQSVLARKEQGLAGGEADREAQAKVEFFTYQQQALESLNGTPRQTGVYEAERRLRYLIGMPASDGALVRPVERASTAPVVYDWEAQLSTALSRRVEVRKQALQVHQEKQRLLAAKNFLLPQVDLIGRYRLRGFGDRLAGDGPRFASALDDLFSLDHQEWEVGVEMQVPAGRRQARVAVQSAKLKVERERAVLAEQQRLVTHELSEAIARVEVLQAAIQVADRRRKAAQQRLQATRAQYEIGKADMHLLLDAQEDQIEAEQRFIETTTEYAIAIKNVSYASGALLSDLGVELAEAQHFADLNLRWLQ